MGGVDGDLSSADDWQLSLLANLLELDPRTLTLEDSMEWTAAISAVTLSCDMFLSSRSGSVTSL